MASLVASTHWDRLVAGYDPVMSSDPSYRSLLARSVGLIPDGATKILDLGSGTGALTGLCRLAHPGALVVGLDPAPAMIGEAQVRFASDPLVTFLLGSAADLSAFSDDEFDAVVSNFALHHLTQPGKRECATEVFR